MKWVLGAAGRSARSCTIPAGNSGWPGMGNHVWLRSACARPVIAIQRIRVPQTNFCSLCSISTGFLCKQMKILWLPGHLNIVPSAFCLIPSVVLKISASRVDIFALSSHSSLGTQLILNIALNQKQTWALGTSIPEVTEGTHTFHQWRKHLGQIFRELSFCGLFFPERRSRG